MHVNTKIEEDNVSEDPQSEAPGPESPDTVSSPSHEGGDLRTAEDPVGPEQAGDAVLATMQAKLETLARRIEELAGGTPPAPPSGADHQQPVTEAVEEDVARAHKALAEQRRELHRLDELHSTWREATVTLISDYAAAIESHEELLASPAPPSLDAQARLELERSSGSATRPAEPVPPHEKPPVAKRPTEHEGAVGVKVRPFSDLPALSEFTRSLARLRGVVSVYIRSLEGDQARIELQVNPHTTLLEELRHELPFELEILDATEREVELELSGYGNGAAGSSGS